jgi:hypothetical protein
LANARIEEAVSDIDGKVGQYDRERDKQNHGLNRLVIT